MALLGHIFLQPTARPRPGRTARWCALIVGGLVWFNGLAASAQELSAPEYKVKAAFLYNFTKLVTWPTNAFTSSAAPLVIGVLGNDPFGDDLDKILAGRSVNGRRLQAARFETVEQVTNCQVLFICESERRKLDLILENLQGKPILTVSDLKGGEPRMMITLVKVNDTLDLRINLEAATRSGLQFSSRLTRLDKSLRPLTGGTTNPPPENPK